MKIFSTICIILVALLLSLSSVSAQRAGDFRSNGTGVWSDKTMWQTYNGSGWVTPGSYPTGTGTITLQGTDSIYIDVVVSISETLRVTGGKFGNTPSLTFISGSVYDHALPNGSIPVSTWGTGSTCLISGFVGSPKPNNANQNFFNFTWNCPGQTGNIDLSMSGNVIGGDVTIDTTGPSRMYLTSPAGYTAPVTINGNIYLKGGQFSSNGSGTSATIVINTLGNLIVTGGNFGVSRGSAPNVNWYLYGDFSVTNATLQNSGGTHINELDFVGTALQTVTLTNVTYGGSGSGPFTMRVMNGAVVDFGTSEIANTNTGSFKVDSGATLRTGHPAGLNGLVQCTAGSNGGGNTLSPYANYTFNGSVAQVTGTLMPDTVRNLTIDNANGVILAKPTVITDTLFLKAGILDNTNAISMGPNGYISIEGGSLLHPLAVEPELEGIPQTFFVAQNYPNPFNPTTTLRYGLPNQSQVTVALYTLLGNKVATVFEGRKEAGVHEVTIDASSLVSGIYFCRVTAGNVSAVQRITLVK